jgi:hypothetical protein
MFHNAKARFKRMVSAHGAVAARPTSPTNTDDESSSSGGGESLYEIVDEDARAATPRLRVMNPDVVVEGERHDSVIDNAAGQGAAIGTIGSLATTPQRHGLSTPNYSRPRRYTALSPADASALAYDGNGSSIASMRQTMHENFARLNVHQHYLDQVVAHMNDAFSAEAQRRAVREQRREAAERLGQRIVAEVVPVAAQGRAYGDVAEIRRCAAPRVEAQMVPDGNYPRFCRSE